MTFYQILLESCAWRKDSLGCIFDKTETVDESLGNNFEVKAQDEMIETMYIVTSIECFATIGRISIDYLF